MILLCDVLSSCISHRALGRIDTVIFQTGENHLAAVTNILFTQTIRKKMSGQLYVVLLDDLEKYCMNYESMVFQTIRYSSKCNATEHILTIKHD